MENKQIQAQWLKIKGNVIKQWGKLTDDDIDEINGSREILIGKIMDKYNKTKEEAEQEVNRFWTQSSH